MKSFRATPIHPQVFLILFIALFQCSALLAGHAGKESTREMDELFRDGFIPRIRIQIPPEGVAELRKYNWRRDGSSDDKVGVQGTVSEGGKTFSNVFIRVKGSAGSFRSIDQNPGLTLNFDKLADGQRFHGLQKLSLNNSIQDASLCSDQFSRELYRKVGVPVPRAGHARVFLNNRDLGLYVLTEGWNKQFLNQFFHKPDGNLYDCTFAKEVGPMMHVNCGVDPFDQSDLDELLAAAELASRKKSLRPLECLDVDRFLRLLVLDGLLWNWDGYAIGHNNYRVFHDFDSQKLIFMPHGMDQLFGQHNSSEMSLTPNYKGMLAKAVLAIPSVRMRYFNRLEELSKDAFRTEAVLARVDKLAERYRQALDNDLKAELDDAVGDLKNRIQQRGSSVARQLANRPGPLRFAADGTARITGWQFKSDPSEMAQGNRIMMSGHEILRLRGTAGDGVGGSWRTLVQLDSGQYELSGLVRTRGEIDPKRRASGVMLRISGHNGTDGFSLTDNEWKAISYSFEVRGKQSVELVCEFRGLPGGVGEFDAASLRLTRKEPAARN